MIDEALYRRVLWTGPTRATPPPQPARPSRPSSQKQNQQYSMTQEAILTMRTPVHKPLKIRLCRHPSTLLFGPAAPVLAAPTRPPGPPCRPRRRASDLEESGQRPTHDTTPHVLRNAPTPPSALTLAVPPSRASARGPQYGNPDPRPRPRHPPHPHGPVPPLVQDRRPPAPRTGETSATTAKPRRPASRVPHATLASGPSVTSCDRSLTAPAAKLKPNIGPLPGYGTYRLGPVPKTRPRTGRGEHRSAGRRRGSISPGRFLQARPR